MFGGEELDEFRQEHVARQLARSTRHIT
jgi:hypothetical protein